jgi:hypothetical protein
MADCYPKRPARAQGVPTIKESEKVMAKKRSLLRRRSRCAFHLQIRPFLVADLAGTTARRADERPAEAPVMGVFRRGKTDFG